MFGGNTRKEQLSGRKVDMDKVTKYEFFLNDVLRGDLKTTLDRREVLYGKIAEYMELQAMLEKLDGNATTKTKLRTKVDIGSNFYVEADITDPKTIIVNVGCGVWLQMNRRDAICFCEKKMSYLNLLVADLTKQELSTKAHINIVLEGLREIQGIDVPERVALSE